MTSKIQILDTTLRDGSYVVDFQLTAHDTAVIARALDENDVAFIEVGHGVGMGASRNPATRAAATDEEYLRAASTAVRKAKWGMFFIPGIATMDDLQLAADHGMSLVRIGTNVTEVEKSEPFVRRAKDLGMLVSANFMKTYAAAPAEVGRFARQSMEYGTDVVCVVDSAGGMFPEDVKAYFEGIREQCNVALGFHGHNNLGLAIANSLTAVELGASIVDTSLRGMGRSAGNAATEILLLALRRRDIDLGIDPLRIMTIAEQKIDPMLRNYQQVDSIGIISGYAQFHSSFMGTISDAAERFSVDPRELILNVTREDKISAPPELVERIARALSERQRVPRRISVPTPKTATTNRTRSVADSARAAATEAHVWAKKYGKTAVFNLVQSYRKPLQTSVSPSVTEGSQYVIASAEVANARDAADVVKAIDGTTPLMLLDCDIKSPASVGIIDASVKHAAQTTPLRYSDLSAWARSVTALVTQRLMTDSNDGSVYVVGADALADQIRTGLGLFGLRDNGPSLLVIVACDAPADTSLVERLRPSGFVVDALIGAVPEFFADACRDRGVPIFRPDMRAILHSEVASAAGVASLVSRVQGMGAINGVAIAAGGMVAPRGTVIVDSVQMPSRVFGVADGRGMLLPREQLSAEFQRRLADVEESVASTVG